ncbi:hypothetical protein PS910_04370 [Pseudomonas fluorescens]|nr:hypothetical protein PS910_04370 [Pseudomonas fluorescens]
MTKDLDSNPASAATTRGIASFSPGAGSHQPLFKIVKGAPADFAREQASVMLGCVRKLTLIGALEEEYEMVWAAHYLSGLAKAIVDDCDPSL